MQRPAGPVMTNYYNANMYYYSPWQPVYYIGCVKPTSTAMPASAHRYVSWKPCCHIVEIRCCCHLPCHQHICVSTKPFCQQCILALTLMPKFLAISLTSNLDKKNYVIFYECPGMKLMQCIRVSNSDMLALFEKIHFWAVLNFFL